MDDSPKDTETCAEPNETFIEERATQRSARIESGDCGPRISSLQNSF